MRDTMCGMKVIALIPARGGSKGIKRKNLQLINDVPLVGLKVKQALRSICDEVWVSTDDDEISNVASDFGASVLNRPAELAADDTSTDLVLKHAVEALNLNNEDVLVLLQPTSPLLTVKSINSCVKLLKENLNISSVITVRQMHPFLWRKVQELNWEPSGHSRDKRLRRQEMPIEGWETGGCYAISVEALKAQGNRYPEPTATVEVTHLESIDIDTLEDLSVVGAIYKSLNENEDHYE